MTSPALLCEPALDEREDDAGALEEECELADPPDPTLDAEECVQTAGVPAS